jgi:hypothetical protein
MQNMQNMLNKQYMLAKKPNEREIQLIQQRICGIHYGSIRVVEVIVLTRIRVLDHLMRHIAISYG